MTIEIKKLKNWLYNTIIYVRTSESASIRCNRQSVSMRIPKLDTQNIHLKIEQF